MRLIRQYLSQIEQYSVVRFIFEMTGWAFLLKLLTFLLLIPVLVVKGGAASMTTTTEQIAAGGLENLIVVTLLVSPLVETILGQWIPISLLKILRAPVWLQLVGSALLFALGHFQAGMVAVVITFPVGVLFSWSYVRYLKYSLWAGLGVPTAIHFLHNLLALSAFLLFRAVF
jgi:membrane protease YdiL (CAAX protease family)